MAAFSQLCLPLAPAVVPILVNGGAAVLPAILVGLGSALAMLLRPRALWRACRRRPMIPLLVIAAGALAWLGATAMWGAERQPSARTAAGAVRPRTDWSAVALDILRRERAGTGASVLADGGLTDDLMMGRDASRGGHDGGPSPVGLSLLWEFKPEGAMFLSSPLVAPAPGGGGLRVFGATCELDVTGKSGSVVCLDAETGKAIWRTTMIGDESMKPFFSSPALTRDGRHLVIGQGLHDDADCSLLCLDAGSGQLRWRVKTPLHIESSPAVRGDLAVVGAGSIEGPGHQPRGDGGFVLAVRISDGAALWRHPLADPESSPAIAPDGTVYIGSGFNGNAVVALRGEADDALKAKGLSRELWRAPIAHPVTGAITLAGDLVIAGAGNGDYVYANPKPEGVVVALDRNSGAIRWQAKMPDAVLGAIAHAGGRLICPVRNGEIVALNAADGAALWRARVSGDAPVLAGPAFAGSHVYAASKDGQLAVFHAGAGRPVEKTYLNDPAIPGELGLSLSSPTVVGGRLYVGSETGGLRCYAAGRGTP